MDDIFYPVVYRPQAEIEAFVYVIHAGILNEDRKKKFTASLIPLGLQK